MVPVERILKVYPRTARSRITAPGPIPQLKDVPISICLIGSCKEPRTCGCLALDHFIRVREFGASGANCPANYRVIQEKLADIVGKFECVIGVCAGLLGHVTSFRRAESASSNCPILRTGIRRRLEFRGDSGPSPAFGGVPYLKARCCGER